MQAVVKTRHIDIKIRGKNIPTKLIYALKDEYGDKVRITDDDDALVNILETPWYKDLKEKMCNPFFLDSESSFDWTVNPTGTGQ